MIHGKPPSGTTLAWAELFVIDRIVLNDEAPLPGELPLLVAALDVLVVLFRIGERP
ncbi:hypothetical protein [Lichenibacterium ramalinae]|uniref:hypothetical protein n=1 Tax=Lichenibacterium ramalinae TaxID=2316527 RepID=UPI0013EBB5FB|nr:hypothetical protein [Lichenibacterium ramalinae]